MRHAMAALKHADDAGSIYVSTLPPERDTKRCPKTIADQRLLVLGVSKLSRLVSQQHEWTPTCFFKDFLAQHEAGAYVYLYIDLKVPVVIVSD